MDIELFKQRLIETATWCQQCSEAEHRLRSPVLRPNFPQAPNAFRFLVTDEKKSLERVVKGDVYLFELIEAETKLQLIEDVAERRTASLDAKNQKALSLSTALAEGKLLAYSSYETLWDGGGEQVTDGFYDVGDTPPWDTWLCYIQEERYHVVSWIPFQWY